jgi:hypothetical protein
MQNKARRVLQVAMICFVVACGLFALYWAVIERTIVLLESAESIDSNSAMQLQISLAVPTLISRHRHSCQNTNTLSGLNYRSRLWTSLHRAWMISHDKRIREYFKSEVESSERRIDGVEFLD